MLDKTIAYHDVLLVRPARTPIRSFNLPEGFCFTYFKEGDEASWSEIESRVGEFDTPREALDYFTQEYMHYSTELKKRCLFIENPDGKKVATSTAWWSRRNRKSIPSLHWIAVIPEFQGKGLAKAGVSESLKHYVGLDGDRNCFLHTQTWSYKAIGIYLKLGFKILTEGTFGKYKNGFEKAFPILKDKMGHRFQRENYLIREI